MNKITPHIQTELQSIATRLPTVMMQTQEFHYLTGAELNEMEIYEDDKGNKLLPAMKYKWACPVQIPTNHYRAVAKAFRKGGEKAVIEYIRKVKAMPVASEA